MQPKRHSRQCTKQGMDVQARRVDLDDRQRTKGGPGLSTNLVRLKTQLNKVRRATQLVSVVIQDARHVVDVGRHPAVYLKTQEAAQEVAKAPGSSLGPQQEVSIWVVCCL